MLPKSQRISKKELALATPYKLIKTSSITARIKKNVVGRLRFSFIISKKIDKRSTERNKLKRQLSIAIQQINLPSIGYDMLIFPKKNITHLSPQEKAKTIADICDQVKRI